MTPRTRARLALGLFAMSILLVIAAIALILLSLDVDVAAFGFRGAIAVLTVAFGCVGVLLAYRRPENPIGWILLASAAIAGFQAFGQELRAYAMARGWREIVSVLDWIELWLWVPMIGLIAIYAMLLFPTGHPVSGRWRWVL